MKNIAVTPKYFCCSVFLLFIAANTLLFLLRIFSQGWWIGDYVAYSGVNLNRHIAAYLSFVAYSVFYLLILYVCIGNGSGFSARKSLTKTAIVLSVLFVFQIWCAYFYGVGVASSTGSASPVFYVLFLFSFDAFYYVYAVIEKNKNRLVFVSFLFVASNILRGWAGFIIPLFLIFFLRMKYVERKKLCYYLFIFICLIPFLLIFRSYFRGGSTHLSVLTGEGFSGIELLMKYFLYVMKAILTRLDFYSHYLGLESLAMSSDIKSACYPIQENVVQKVLVIIGFSQECVSLGSLLPSFLYDFFEGKGTSFSVGSGFFGLPAHLVFPYFLSYLLVLLCSVFIVRFFVKCIELRVVFLYLAFFILFQGWMYQFVYNFSGYLVGLVFVLSKFDKKIFYVNS